MLSTTNNLKTQDVTPFATMFAIHVPVSKMQGDGDKGDDEEEEEEEEKEGVTSIAPHMD